MEPFLTDPAVKVVMPHAEHAQETQTVNALLALADSFYQMVSVCLVLKMPCATDHLFSDAKKDMFIQKVNVCKVRKNLHKPTLLAPVHHT